jgi:hypothetical protein
VKRLGSPLSLQRLPTKVAIEPLTSNAPALLLIQVKNQVQVALHDVKALIEALTDAATGLVIVQVGSGAGDGGDRVH